MDSKKLSEDPSTKELNQFVQNMLKQMQERFDDMSSNIVGRVDEMGKHSVIKVDASTTSRSRWERL
jgi:predicted Zn-dependent protease with MMP-like domain